MEPLLGAMRLEMESPHVPGLAGASRVDDLGRMQRRVAHLESLLASVDGIVWEADGRTFQFTFVNRQAERLLGYPTTRWTAEPTFWRDHLHPEDREWAVDFCRTATEEGRNHELEYRMIAADGREVWLHDVVTVERDAAGTPHLRGLMVEVSSRRRAEDSFLALVTATADAGGAEFFREVTRQLAHALGMDLALVGELVDENPLRLRTLAVWGGETWLENEQYEASGTPCEHVIRQGTLCLFPRDVARLFPQDEFLQRFGAESYIGAPLVGTAGGVRGHVCVLGRSALVDEDRARSLLRIFALRTAMELERQRTEESLRRSESRYRGIFDTAGVALWEVDLSGVRSALLELPNEVRADLRPWLEAHPDFVAATLAAARPVAVNDAAVRLYGAHSREELLAGPLEQGFTEETKTAFFQALLALIAGRPRFQARTRLRTLRGDVLEVWLAVTFPADAGGFHHVPVSVTDLTELHRVEREHRRAQEQLLLQQRAEKERIQSELGRLRDRLVQQTRLSVIGQVAASIAHDLRNPLGSIRNACFFLSRRATDTKWLEYLKIVEQEVETAERFIDNLLEMTRAREPRREPVEVVHAVHQAWRAVGTDRVTLHVSAQPDPFVVDADPAQLQRVLANLLVNAVQAVGGPGNVTISAHRAEGDDVIVCEDDGPGIAPQDRARVFEPLFTTRARGTGLGLAICRQIVERHGGTIDLLDSAAGGARFLLRLPRRGD